MDLPATPLSPDEMALLTVDPWQLYERAYARALKARDELCALIDNGLPVLHRLPDGGFDGVDGLKHMKIKDSITRFATANRILYAAAGTLCDCAALADDGEREGIKWEVFLSVKVTT